MKIAMTNPLCNPIKGSFVYLDLNFLLVTVMNEMNTVTKVKSKSFQIVHRNSF